MYWRPILDGFQDAVGTFQTGLARVDLRSRTQVDQCGMPYPGDDPWRRFFPTRTPFQVGKPLSTWLRHGDKHGKVRHGVPINRFGWVPVEVVESVLGRNPKQLRALAHLDRKGSFEILMLQRRLPTTHVVWMGGCG